MLQQTEVQKSVYTAFRDSPFTLQESVKEVYVKAGSSIQEIIDEAIKEEWQRKYLRVVLNDEVIQPENYALTFVNEKDVVGMVLVPQGGDAGQILKAVAIIAIVVVVSYFTAGALGPGTAAGLSAGQASAIGAGVGAVAGLAASLALNALFPPPVPGLPSTGSSGTSEDPVYGFSRTGNQLGKYAAIPRIYGTRKVFPQHAIAPYIIAQGSNQYLYQAFTAGYGPLKIEDIMIGENPIGNYKDVEYYIHEAFEAGDELKIVKEDNWQDPYSIKLERDAENIVVTTDDAEKASLAIQFGQGLFTLDRTNGNKLATRVFFEIKARQSGTSTWFPLTDFSPIVTDAVIKSTVTSNTWNAVGTTYFGIPHYSVVTDLPASSSVANNEYKTLVTTTNDYFGNYLEAYQDYQNSYAVASSTNQIEVEKTTSRPFFVNVNLTLPSAGKWEFQVVRTQAFTNNGSWLDISDWTTSDQTYNEAYISSLRSIKATAPIASDKPISLIELKIRATDQLNGAVSNLSCLVTSKLMVYSGSTWSIEATRNPAWAYLDVMRGSAAKKPIDSARIDLDSFIDWANWCDQQQPNFSGTFVSRACCDLEITSQTTAWEVLKLISATGYATPAQNSGKYSITVDKPKSTAVQVFTPKNIQSFSGSMSYHIQPHALRMSFTRFRETDTDEIIVYDDGYNADGSGGKQQATIFEEMKLIGVGRYQQAYTIGRRSLAQGKLRIETFTISCDVENLLATRGSLVRLQHDVPKIGSGSGRVVSVSGSNITIDDDFKLTTGSVYAHVRHLDGNQSVRNLYSINGRNAIISGTSLSEGDLLIYGELNRVDLECLVKSVRPGNDLTATVELVPYAPGIYTAEVAEIPARDPWGSSWSGGGDGGTTSPNITTPGMVSSLKGTYQLVFENKSPKITVSLSWGKPYLGGEAYSYKVYFRDTNNWRLLGETTELSFIAFNEYTFTDANGDPINLNGKTLRFAVSAVGKDLSSYPADTASQVTIIPTIQNPTSALGLSAVGGFFENVLTWTYQTDGFDVAFVEIWGNLGTNNRDIATLIAKVPVPAVNYKHTGLDVTQVWYYWIRLVDSNGNFSEWFPESATAGVQCSPSSDPQYLLDVLFEAINTDQIAAELNERIDLIDIGGNLAYPEIPNGLIAKVNVHDGDINQLNADTDELANNLLDASVLIDKHENMITGAGIYVDEGTGTVRIFGVDNLQGQLNLVEADLDAANAQIALRATQAYVDQAIVDAVIDPSQIAELDDLYARVSTVEVDLDAAETAIGLKASLTTVNGIDARLSTAEIDIDALEGEIVTKVSNTEFDDLGARVTTAEETLSTINGAEITRSVEDVRYLYKEQDLAAEAVLRNLFTEERNFNLTQGAIAFADETLRAYTDGKTLAEAEARLALGAALETADAELAASITTEQTARVTADEAEATAREELAAQIESDLATVNGSIVNEASIRLAADQAEASARQALQVTLENDVSDLEAAITNEATVRANADSAEASARTTLAARLDTDIATTQAYIIDEQNARVSADSALTTSINSLTATVNSNTAAIQNEATARANADSANATQITNVQARLDTGDFAAVKVSASASANAITGLNAKWGVQVNAGGQVAGIALNSGGQSYSSFTVLADVFNVYHPSDGTPRQMFGMGYVNGAYRVGINGSLIVDGSITARRLAVGTITAASGVIDDLAVDTLQIAGNAVTVPTASSGGGYYLQTYFQNVATLTIYLNKAGWVYATFNGNQGYPEGIAATEHYIYINGVQVCRLWTGDSYATSISGSGASYCNAGYVTVILKSRKTATAGNPARTVGFTDIGLYVQGMKK